MNHRARHLYVLLALALAVTGTGVSSGETATPAALLEQVRTAGVDRGAAVRVSGFRLRSGDATVELTDGVLVPARSLGDRPAEIAFVGTGRVGLVPPDPIEAGQLELFTGAASLDEAFDRAIFVIARDEAVDALLRLPAAAGDPRVAAAAVLLGDWQTGPERRLLDVEARLLVDAVGGPLGVDYFCGAFEGRILGRFLYVVDPLSDEQVTLGQFVRPDLTQRQQRQARRHLERAQREGKLIGLEVEDLGTWDTWVSTPLRAADGRPAPGSTGVEPVRYGLDVTLRGDALELEAVARIDLDVRADGLRTVLLQMSSDLIPTAVRDAGGRELEFLRTRQELAVVLPEPLAAGTQTTIEVHYRGRPFERLGSDTYAQRRTLGWYPHAGSVDRATYEVTVRWPERLGLEGCGRVVADGVEGDGLRWQRRVLGVRSLGFSFEVGRFEVLTQQVGHVRITVAGLPAGPRLAGPGLIVEPARHIFDSVRDSLGYFEDVFGPYPLDELVVVSAPRGASQGLPGFITLGTPVTRDWNVWSEILGSQDRRTVIAHEVAHQWWGNLVGWSSYRDQWISEAMANYSALLYARNRLPAGGAGAVRSGPTRGWQGALLARTAGGRPVESLGPVVMGTRLLSSVGGNAYTSIVYKKGAVVLDMLSRFFTEEVFLEILREVVRVASERLVSTADFLGLVERIGGTDLDWFARQYVYGTGLPEIEYGYRFLPEGSGWVVEGEARQRAPYHLHYRVERRPDSSFDVVRRADERIDVDRSVLAVPVQVGVADGSSGRTAAESDGRGLMVGRVVVQGAVSRFRFELEPRPEVFWLDRDGEVFGRFFSVDHRPRLAGYQLGLDLAASGATEAAEAALREALAADVARFPEEWQEYEGDPGYEGRLLDAGIRLALTRLYLDTGRDAAAAAELEAAQDVMPTGNRRLFEADLVALDARLALRAGRAARAYRSLRRAILKEGSVDTAEGFALLAAAAHAADQQQVAETACRRAARLGVDLSELGCP